MAERKNPSQSEPSALALIVHRTAFNAFAEGGKLYEAKRYEEALAAINNGLQKYSKYAPAFYNKGVILTHLGRNEEALSAYDQAIQLDSTDSEPFGKKASALNKLKRYNEAITAATHALRLDAENVSARYARANALFELGRYQEAINEYNSFLSRLYSNEKVTNKNELQNGANRSIAMAWMKLNQYENAVNASDSALSYDTSDFRSLLIKGEALQHLNQHERAIYVYDRVLPLIRQQPMHIRLPLELDAEWDKKQSQAALDEEKKERENKLQAEKRKEEERLRQEEKQKQEEREHLEKISTQIQTQTQEIMKKLGTREELEQLNRRLYGGKGKILEVHKEVSRFLPAVKVPGSAFTYPGSSINYLASGIVLIGVDSRNDLSSMIFVGTMGKSVAEREANDFTMGKVHVGTFVIKSKDWWEKDYINYSLGAVNHRVEDEIMDYVPNAPSGASTESQSTPPKSFGTRNYFLQRNTFENYFLSYNTSKERRALHERLDKITSDSLMKLYEKESTSSQNNSTAPDSAQGHAQAEEAAKMRRSIWDFAERSGLGHPSNVPNPNNAPPGYYQGGKASNTPQIGPDGKPIPPRKPPGNAFG